MEQSPQNQLRAIEVTCREQVQQLADAIQLKEISDIEALCLAISRKRKRPMVLIPMELIGDETGFSASAPEYDTIYYARDVSPPYQEHIILHELAHLLLNHRPPHTVAAATEIRQTVVPLLGASYLPPMLKRSRYDLVHEQEAELFASLLEQRWRRARPVRKLHPTDEHQGPVLQWLREQNGEREE